MLYFSAPQKTHPLQIFYDFSIIFQHFRLKSYAENENALSDVNPTSVL